MRWGGEAHGGCPCQLWTRPSMALYSERVCSTGDVHSMLIATHHGNRYVHHFLRWYRIRPGAGFLLSLSPERKVERPHSKGFGMGRSLGCPRYGIVCINIISPLYVYIYLYIQFIIIIRDMLMPATTLLSRWCIDPHYLGGKWSVCAPGSCSGGGGGGGGGVCVGWRLGVSGWKVEWTSGDTGHQGTGHLPLIIHLNTAFRNLSLNLNDKLLTDVTTSLKCIYNSLPSHHHLTPRDPPLHQTVHP